MRYENWDILLFPEGARVPIQEFKTQCFVTRDTESPYLQNPSLLGPNAYLRVQGSHGHIPILTSFIPTLPRDSCFRVSIHSWENPRPSRLTESLMQPDDVLLYEARVFVDGICVAAGVFGPRAAWPYVINVDREGNQDYLRFPPFHGQILEQRHWNASDELGRIRIVLAEGFSRPNRSPPFERVKDVIVFSFQHAPQHILEFSQIAWPNPQMWPQATSRTVYKVDQSNYVDAREPEDTHAHSPRKPDMRVPMTSVASMVSNIPSSSSQVPIAYHNAWASGRAFPLSTSQLYPFSAHTPSRNPRWAGYSDRQQDSSFIQPVRDPFTDDVTWRHRGARSSREDVPMPDYSSSGSRAISSVAGMSFEHSKHSSMSAPMDEEHYNLLIDAMTPTKPPMGTRAPSNTPSTMAVLPVTATTPATQVRKASANKQGSLRTSGLHERSQPSSRDVSGSASILAEKITSPAKIGVSPSANVKSRKEGDMEKHEKENESTVGTDL
ncbi:hypothetical protein PEBR_15449 [Penicillium brasilianum]|uniref:Uncharacterized protein n=1 Tax=Penicillium brasilianum TaxID=104259 RepID=A0A1S9RPW3_PENBI|nr:hypothetical protein PEBR_15449 [Penicillium brasilianum]